MRKKSGWWMKLSMIVPNIFNPWIVTLIVIGVTIYMYPMVYINVINSIDWKLLLEYLKVILSLPVVILVIGLISMKRFEDSISKFLKNTHRIKAGSFEAEAKYSEQPQPSDIDSEVRNSLHERGITLDQAQAKLLEDEFNRLIEDNSNKSQKISDQDNYIEWITARAVQYEFKYLELFLVFRSKFALFMLRKDAMQKNDFFNAINTEILPDPNREKLAVFDALWENELITLSGDLICITDKGERFLAFLDRAGNDCERSK